MKVVTIVGARPQFIKACMLSKVFMKTSKINEVLVHTGQHYDSDMSNIFFEQLKIPKPDYHLAVGSDSHGRQTAMMLIELENILIKEKPNLVLVYGDTNSTLAGALAAAKLHIPIAHVEAGLRSYNKKMPEEQNRILTDHLSTLFFCPTDTAVENLKKEGIKTGIFQTGDIMCDTVKYFQPIAQKYSSILSRFDLTKGSYYTATIHRAENTGDCNQLSELFNTLNDIGERVVIPIHPRTNVTMEKFGIEKAKFSNILFVKPVNYFDMLTLVSHSKKVLTDSGGLQKEAYLLGTPCITLRDETEWKETVSVGWNTVVGTNSKKILDAVQNVQVPKEHPLLFGDGNASERILEGILNFK